VTDNVEEFVLLSEYCGQLIVAGSFTQLPLELLIYPVIHSQTFNTIFLLTSLHTHTLLVEVDSAGHYLHTTLVVIVVS